MYVRHAQPGQRGRDLAVEARRSRLVDVRAPRLLGAREELLRQVQAPARRGLGEMRVEELRQLARLEAIRKRSRGGDDRGRRAQVEDRVRPERVRDGLWDLSLIHI